MPICRFDKGEIKGKAKRTDEGYIRAEAIVTRTGVFLYRNSDGSIRRELRHPDDVFSKESLDTLKMIPVTDGHPEQKLVNAENAKELAIGNTGENVYPDGQNILASLVITHKDGVDSVDMKGRKELSLGYELDLEEVEGEYNGERYDCRQRNIRYNHLAIVDRARAGGAARIHLDSGDALQTEGKPKTEPKKETRKMKTVTLDGIEYEAAPEVINALTKAEARADKAETELTETKEALDGAKKEKDTIAADRDTLKEKLETKLDGEELQKAVKARLDLERVAGKVLNEDEAQKISEMSDADIKNAVIKAHFPNANMDGVSEDYIQARFDIAAEEVGNQKSSADQKKQMGERLDGSQSINLDDKQEEALNSFKNMHKKEK